MNLEELARQLHDWYLEATTNIGDVNPNAQRPYEELSDDQRDIDRYIANKLTQLITKEIKQAREDTVESYTNYLHQQGYIDSDYYTEEPDPRQEFLKLNKD